MIPIVVYGPNPDAPAAMRYAAAMVSDGRPGSHWLATAPSADQAREKLEALWRRQYPDRAARAPRESLDDLV